MDDDARETRKHAHLGECLEATLLVKTEKVSTSVAAVCTQRLWVLTRVPVSSVWTTGDRLSCSVTVETNGSRRVAPSCCTWHSQPVDTSAPRISASSLGGAL